LKIDFFVQVAEWNLHACGGIAETRHEIQSEIIAGLAHEVTSLAVRRQMKTLTWTLLL